MSLDVDYFRPRRTGRESQIEDVVAKNLPGLFGSGSCSRWTAGSVPLGAGMPDLVFVEFVPEVMAIAHLTIGNAQILAYLRAVRSANDSRIGQRTNHSGKALRTVLLDMETNCVLKRDGKRYELRKSWHKILTNVISVEVKISNWKRAVSQAARNRLFSNQSYIALPYRTASRLKSEAIIRSLGIGILAVKDDGTVESIKKARLIKPLVWTYYYKLAAFLAYRHALHLPT